MSTSTQQVSLIIASRNRAQMLHDTVGSILEGQFLPDELLIIDQSTRPDPFFSSLPDRPGCEIRYRWMQASGLSRANNAGVRAARYPILAFTHDDVLVPAGWLKNLIEALAGAEARSVVTGRVLPAPIARPGGFVPSTIEKGTPAVYTGRIGGFDPLYPLNMAMYRSVFADIGYFDERLGPGTAFPAGEDNDFGFRLLEGGYRIVYVPEAMLYHRAWRAKADYLPLRWAYGLGQGAFYAKHLSVRDRYMLAVFIRRVATKLAGAVGRLRACRRDAAGDIVYIGGILFGVMRWFLMHPKIG